jgi:TonB family protein
MNVRHLAYSICLAVVIFAVRASSGGERTQLKGKSRISADVIEIKDDPLYIGCGVQVEHTTAEWKDDDWFCNEVMPGLQRRIQREWLALAPRRPPAVQPQATTTVQFLLKSNGTVGWKSVTRSSGAKLLDAIAVQAISAGQPYPSFPPSMVRSEMIVNYTFTYDGPMQRQNLPADLAVWWRGGASNVSPQQNEEVSCGVLLLPNDLTRTEWQHVSEDYLQVFGKELENSWSTASNLGGEGTYKAILQADVTILPNGSLKDFSWVTIPENATLTDAVKQSVTKVFPVSPFPTWLKAPTLTVRLFFLYHVNPNDVW